MRERERLNVNLRIEGFNFLTSGLRAFEVTKLQGLSNLSVW